MPLTIGFLGTLKWLIAGAFAVWFARLCRKPTGPLGRAFVHRMNASHAALTTWGLSHVSVGPSFTTLDIGCGGGRTMQRLASMSPAGRVMGIDVSPQSVAVARKTNEDAIARGQMGVQLGRVSALPYRDATFDLATAVETHYYWPDLVRDLGEVKRVLEPGGRVAIIAETYRGRRMDWLYRPVMTLLLRATYLTPEQHEQALRAAGFADVRAFVERAQGWLTVTGTKPT